MYKFSFTGQHGFVKAISAGSAKRKLAKHYGVPPKFFEVERADVCVLVKKV